MFFLALIIEPLEIFVIIANNYRRSGYCDESRLGIDLTENCLGEETT